MDYAALKLVHVGSAALSIAGFVGRGFLMLQAAPLLQTRFVRVAPHVVDTVLLASALGLAWTSRQYPVRQGWLTAKVAGLLAYVVLGSIALKHGRTRVIRVIAFVLALCAAGYVVSAAVTRSPLGMFAGLT